MIVINNVHGNQFIVVVQIDRFQAVTANVGKFADRRALDYPQLGGKEQVLVVVILTALNVDYGTDLFVAVNPQQVDHWNPLSRPTIFGYLIPLHRKDLPGIGEEEQFIVRRAGNEVLNKVVTVHSHPLNAPATPVLGLELIDRQAFDVTVMGQGHDDLFFFDEIFIL